MNFSNPAILTNNRRKPPFGNGFVLFLVVHVLLEYEAGELEGQSGIGCGFGEEGWFVDGEAYFGLVGSTDF